VVGSPHPVRKMATPPANILKRFEADSLRRL
jgi:hypothetical protein